MSNDNLEERLDPLLTRWWTGVHSNLAKSWKDESGNITTEHLAWLKDFL
jgi:hypothetical protein